MSQCVKTYIFMTFLCKMMGENAHKTINSDPDKLLICITCKNRMR